MKAIDIGGRKIGLGAPCFIVAEAGINHNGDMDLARRTIQAAARAGADAVKFQNYRTEDFISDRSLTYEYVSQGKKVVEPQQDMFKRCQLTPAMLRTLQEECAKHEVVFFSTPTSEETLKDLISLKVPLLKNGSDYLTHLPLIRAMARSGIPTVLSTGMATLAEISDAVEAFRTAGGRDLMLLHCTSAYPTPPGAVNLRRIPALAERFDCPIGFSDHTEGFVAAAASISYGSCFLEKHFTLDRDLPGPDHRFSSDGAGFALLVQAVRQAEVMAGSAEIVPADAELLNRRDARLSCVAARDLPAGHVVTAADIAFRRPGTGLPPKSAEQLIGRRLLTPAKAGSLLQLENLAAR